VGTLVLWRAAAWAMGSALPASQPEALEAQDARLRRAGAIVVLGKAAVVFDWLMLRAAS
jgi:hypothetical protein